MALSPVTTRMIPGTTATVGANVPGRALASPQFRCLLRELLTWCFDMVERVTGIEPHYQLEKQSGYG
jgi:hypothetical protein